ncbi:MAG: glycosyltransferase [Flavobacteriales bacterium]|nr:glycosyltransferase [Flavobacteriales bacterium]
MPKPTQHICLNMIVKNERHVIERSLASVKGIISSWAIVDTGSEDGTQDCIRNYLTDIPGKLVERPWVNFAHNRTEALNYIHEDADYILIVDADEEIKFDKGFEFPTLNNDCYYLQSRLNGMHYYRMQLVKYGIQWRWESKLHEYITADSHAPPLVIEGIYDVPHPDGFRSSNPNKYKQDAITLEQALLDEPDNHRYCFYLAQSYRDCGDLELAIRYYTQRVRMEGWPEEVWYSLYQIALLKMKMGESWETVQMALLDAYNYRHQRTESLYSIITYYREKEAWPLAYSFASQAIQVSYPNDLLFIEPKAYGPPIWLEYAQAAQGMRYWEKAISICNYILASSKSCSASCSSLARTV